MRYVGIDWGGEVHTVALVDPAGNTLEEWEVEQAPEAVKALLERLEVHGGPTGLSIALEPGSPLLMAQLLQAGYPLYPINPKQADRWRDRYAVSGAKDDRRDARILARVLATDIQHLQRLEPESDLSQELLLRSRARTRLVQQRVAQGNRLRDLLKRYYPTLLNLRRDVHEPLFLALLKAYPDATAAGRSHRGRIAKILKKQRIRSLSADEVRAVLHGPAFSVPPAELAAHRDEALDLAAQLHGLNQQIRQAEERLEQLFEKHPDRDLLLSLDGMGLNIAIRVGIGLGCNRVQRLDPSILQCHAGSAPVTKSTGRKRRRGRQPRTYGSHRVRMRRACDRDIQSAVNQWAACSLPKSTWARACYDHLRAKGKGHNAALRALGNKWVKILAAVIKTRQPYSEERHVSDLVSAGVPWAQGLANLAA
jgi:transposase